MHNSARYGWKRPGILALVAAFSTLGMVPGKPPTTAQPARPAEIRVGITQGDLQGDDHRALQAAVDYVARLGGGTVHIGPGQYRMRNALTLRDNFRICGVPGKTILAGSICSDATIFASATVSSTLTTAMASASRCQSR